MTNEQKTIIVVDDNNANLIACKNILKPHYVVYPTTSSEKMFELLEHFIPDLILLDVEMPGIDGYETVRRLKSNDAHMGIPIIFLSARSDTTSEMEGLNLGAIDYIHKPFFSALLLKRIELHLSMINYRKTLKERDGYIKKLIAHISKIEDESLKLLCDEFDLGSMLSNITGAINESARAKLRSIILSLKKDIPLSVVADELRLSLVIANLLLYALRFTGENEKIVLSVEKEEETDDEITFRFEIAANGMVVSGEPRKQLLASFEQLEGAVLPAFDDTEFAPAILKRIVELMNGRMWIEVEGDRGAKFLFTIRVKKGKAKAVKQ